jgi:hypothetical protein
VHKISPTCSSTSRYELPRTLLRASSPPLVLAFPPPFFLISFS